MTFAIGSGQVFGLARGATDPLTISLLAAIEATATDIGINTRRLGPGDDESSLAALLTVGLPQYYLALLGRPRRARRIAWFGEPLPHPRDNTDALDGPAGRAMVRAVRPLGRPVRWLRQVPLPGPLEELRAAAYVGLERQANLQAALRTAASVDQVVVTSRDRAATLAMFGVSTTVVPFGYHPTLSGPIVSATAPRDLPALALGSGIEWASRRARGLRACLHRLGPSNLRVAASLWGEERNAVLARTRILLDVHRVPGNFIGLRVLLAAAAGAVLVTEPMDDPWPFEPGRHFVDAPLADLPDAVRDLLADELRRREIVVATQELMAGPLSMRASLQAVLA